MILYYDRRIETISFGAKSLKEALANRGEFYIEKELSSFTHAAGQKTLVAFFRDENIDSPSDQLEEGGFEIKVKGNTIYLIGIDHNGVMYGLMDIGETIRFYGLDAIANKVENPVMKMRGFKFNLPFEPYDIGDPFEKNQKTCLDINYWREFIDFLALNRYNCLSLWSEHPFHMMFKLNKYPDTCPYSDVEMEEFKNLYKFIFKHAKNRGMDVYIITWNIRITPFIAKGLGLPGELGDMKDRYNVIYDGHNKIPNNTSILNVVRQHSEVVRDYLKECIKTLLMTYIDLTGIGTTCSEEMAGSIEIRHQWVVDTYLEAIKEVGREIPFIHRTNSTNGKLTKEVFLDQYPYKGKYISWKYSNAHMYSHPVPQFEKLWNAWGDMSFDDVKVIYTVRNDDFHTLRWGDPTYIRDYVRGMNKPHVNGFYWGADGYLWGEDFQHIPHGHKTWKYDFEKHWYEFELMGRMGYNPELPEAIWIEKCKVHYGKQWGEKYYIAMKAASKIIPAVNRLFWINYDFEWHPESLLTVFGFKTILDFMNGKSMPGVGTIGIKDFVSGELSKAQTEGETPNDIIEIIRKAIQDIRKQTGELNQDIPKEYLDGEIVCTMRDLEAWEQLGMYYMCKFQAALKLAYFVATGKEEYKDQAVTYLEEGLKAWKELSRIGASHYMPYKMTRSKYIFGWSYYVEDVEKDIDLAKNLKSDV